MIFIAVLSTTIFRSSFLKIESHSVEKNIDRAVNALTDNINALMSQAKDWAVWDDTYFFINDANQEYIDSNPSDETFMNLRLNFIIFVDNSNNVVYSKYFDFNSEKIIDEPTGLTSAVMANNKNIIGKAEPASIDGLVNLGGERLAMLSTQPIIRSDGTGPVNGTITFGRFFNEAEVQNIAEVTNLSVKVSQVGSTLPLDFKEAMTQMESTGQEYFVKALDADYISGYTIVKDINAKPLLIMEAKLDRNIYDTWRKSTLWLLISLAVISASIIIGSGKYIDQILLRRLMYISNNVKKINLDYIIDEKLNLKGKDELASLSTDINNMLDRIKTLTFHDYLTGLYNRAYFEEELKRLDVKRQLPLSIIIGDVNGLKLVNDALGHDAGDVLLKKIAKVLKESFRKEDIIARWGGDEFSIILPATSNEVANKIIQRVKERCEKNSTDEMKLSISFGVSTKIEESEDTQELTKSSEEQMYRRKMVEQKSIHSSMISSLAKALSERDYETEEHVERMRDYATLLGMQLDLSESQIDDLSLLATLHDIGKIAIADNIILKPGKLTSEEFEAVKKHPEIGFRIATSSLELVPIADAILYHHEWWNGKGYPKGLKGEEIPLLARIISVVDSYDAMTSDRPYRKAMCKEAAIQELSLFAGKQFDPVIVEKFIDIINRLLGKQSKRQTKRNSAGKDNLIVDVETKIAEKVSVGIVVSKK